jgi:uncharacterized membrane protein
MWRATHTADKFLLTPAMVAILGTGIYLVLDGPFDWSDTFVTVGLTGIILLFLLAHGFFGRYEKKLMNLSQRDVDAARQGEVELSDEYVAGSKLVARVGTLAGLLVLTIIFFMVVKP